MDLTHAEIEASMQDGEDFLDELEAEHATAQAAEVERGEIEWEEIQEVRRARLRLEERLVPDGRVSLSPFDAMSAMDVAMHNLRPAAMSALHSENARLRLETDRLRMRHADLEIRYHRFQCFHEYNVAVERGCLRKARRLATSEFTPLERIMDNLDLYSSSPVFQDALAKYNVIRRIFNYVVTASRLLGEEVEPPDTSDDSEHDLESVHSFPGLDA
ncbi:unnamed protein product [Polarella glacialis]|uniref:Uncharacterized protein n=1 Tax=Polarella glacialis TaxID=89957 RepID=A0A813FMD3_POLGL|nr:unnamed protein product [Polarella glacialis]